MIGYKINTSWSLEHLNSDNFLQEQLLFVLSGPCMHWAQAKTEGKCQLVNQSSPTFKGEWTFPPTNPKLRKKPLPYFLWQKQREGVSCFARQNRKCCFSSSLHRRELKPTMHKTPLPLRWSSELVTKSWEIWRIQRILKPTSVFCFFYGLLFACVSYLFQWLCVRSHCVAL